MEWEVAALADEVLVLLADGPASVSQLETATGRPATEIERTLATLFAAWRVEPVGGSWRRARVAVAPAA